MNGRNVPESSAADAAVAQLAPVQHQAGAALPAFHAAAYVHLNPKKCCGFLEIDIDHVIGCRKALRSPMRNRELHRTTESFRAVDGARARQSRKTRDLTEIVMKRQIHTT